MLCMLAGWYQVQQRLGCLTRYVLALLAGPLKEHNVPLLHNDT